MNKLDDDEILSTVLRLLSTMNSGDAASISRRRFLLMAVAAAFFANIEKADAVPSRGGVPYRILGRTGQKVSAIGLGGYHIGTQWDENESIRIIHMAIDGGINFLDNCWDYNNGHSEIRMGKALKSGYRDKAFLMTKIDGRDRKTAASQIDESLKRLDTDRIDLVQFHEIIRLTDPDKVFAPGGAMEATLAAQKAGKIRFIGFTGHKHPNMHLKMLETSRAHGITFDTVQMPLNVMDAHYESFEKLVLPVLIKDNIGVLGMKPLAAGAIPNSKFVSAVDCLHYAMSLPTSVVITGCDSIRVLEQALSAARTFKPFTKDERLALLAKTAKLAQSGQYERYKTSKLFDGTSFHPDWMG